MADIRSEHFAANLTRKMEDAHENLAVVITGGFHSDGFLSELKKQGIGYLSIKPRLTKQDAANPYFSILQGKKLPIEKLLAKNQTILAPRVWPEVREFKLAVTIPQAVLGRFLSSQVKAQLQTEYTDAGLKLTGMTAAQATEAARAVKVNFSSPRGCALYLVEARGNQFLAMAMPAGMRFGQHPEAQMTFNLGGIFRNHEYRLVTGDWKTLAEITVGLKRGQEQAEEKRSIWSRIAGSELWTRVVAKAVALRGSVIRNLRKQLSASWRQVAGYGLRFFLNFKQTSSTPWLTTLAVIAEAGIFVLLLWLVHDPNLATAGSLAVMIKASVLFPGLPRKRDESAGIFNPPGNTSPSITQLVKYLQAVVPPELLQKHIDHLAALDVPEQEMLLFLMTKVQPEELLDFLSEFGLGIPDENLLSISPREERLLALLGLTEPIRTWLGIENALNACALFPGASHRIIPLIVVTLRLMTQGIGFESRFSSRKEHAVDLLPRLQIKMIRTLEKIRAPWLQKRLVKVLSLGNHEQIEQACDLAEAWVKALYGVDSQHDAIGQIRNGIHNNPSPEDLPIVGAYLEYLRTGSQTALNKFGFFLAEIEKQRLADKRDLMLIKTQELYEALGDIYGESNVNKIEEVLRKWSGLKQDDELRTQISRMLRDERDVNAHSLSELAAVRKSLLERSRKMTGDDLLQALVLNNHLETLLFSRFNAMMKIPGIFEGEKMLQVLVDLLANIQSVEYQREEVTELNYELQKLQARPLSDTWAWLKYFSVLKRIERIFQRATEEVIFNYQPIAEKLGEKLARNNDPLILEFASKFFRRDIFFSLSRAVREARKQAIEKAGISGWDIMVHGGAVGRIRYVGDPKDLKNVQSDEIIVINRLPLDANVKGIRGIILLEEDSLLSHPAIQARKFGIPLVVSPDRTILEKYKGGDWIRLTARGEDEVVLEKIEEPKLSQGPPVKASPSIQLIPADTSRRESVVLPERYTQGTVGNKAFRLGRLNAILEKIKAGVFKPRHFTINFSLYQKVLANPENNAVHARLEDLILQASAALKAENLPAILEEIRNLLEGLKIPDDELNLIRQTINKSFGKNARVFLRSSTNAEDLPGFPAAGQYDSFGNIEPTNAELAKYIKKIWASTWNDRAFHDRETHRIRHTDVAMAVLVQETVPADYAFVVHTENPSNPDEVLVEVVQGLGESLVSGAPEFAGSPYRFAYHKKTGEVRIVRFANKSKKIIIENGSMKTVRASYVDDPLTTKQGLRFIKKIAETSLKIEQGFGSPQDIEGAVKLEGSTWRPAYLQSRDQIEVLKPGNQA
ncbi:MAG: hypothetical protein HGA76_07950, partial [Candidatus Firestonebacteria bacterium]|nr:hypothetical protein [Candidatus Firestonebacteria bacterium]